MRVRFQGLELGHTGRRPGEVLIENVDWSYPEQRSHDWEREGRDGSVPGRDFLGVRTVSFDLATNRGTMVQARDTAARFLHAWRDRALRDTSGTLVPLEFQAVDDPRWRRVYGRPRRADDPDFGVLMRQGVARVTCDFDVLEPRVFSGGSPESVRLNHFPEQSQGGWYAPFVFPLMSERVTGSRAGYLRVGGELPTPATVTFGGPGRAFSLDGSRGWHVGLKQDVSLAWDERLEINPLLGTVQSYFTDAPDRRTNRFGALDRRSTLSRISIDPGEENVFFSAVDDTNDSFAVIEWREAFSSIA